MTAARIAAVSLVVLCTAIGQVRPSLTRPPTRALQSPDRVLRLLAAMVEFQTDDDATTTGTGAFQNASDARWTIDPPPHDRAYFESKIEFVNHYFSTVSGGKLLIEGVVLPNVVRLPKKMKAYAPPVNGKEVRSLAEMAESAWHLADSVHPAVDFGAFDLFVIFHAGSGRDIDLVSMLGYNPTYSDLPSLTFDSSGFARAFGTSTFTGFPVDGGAARITNTIILPETESRLIPTISGDAPLQLSINGLFTASIGSALGLPDLFDTETGKSAIGQFGLMDGASIFAYNGIFPPRPSAWERIQLGWVTPIDISTAQQNIPLPAAGSNGTLSDTIYRVRISPSEYYLIENRSRDIQGDGQRITAIQPGVGRVTQYFAEDAAGFNMFSTDSVRGSIVAVEDYDWAMPGSMDSTQKYDGGGVLIWHVDEDVIRAQRGTNTVNANPLRRGVDLEEADGSEDIGESYPDFTSGQIAQYGSPLDCWFGANSSPVYRNVFDAASTPSSSGSMGGRTLIRLADFSQRSRRMSFSVSFGDEQLVPLPGFPKSVTDAQDGPLPITIGGTKAGLVFSKNIPGGRGQIVGWNQDGERILPSLATTGVMAEIDVPRFVDRIAAFRAPSGATYLGAAADGMYLWKIEDQNTDASIDLLSKVPDSTNQQRALMFVDTLLVGVGRTGVDVVGLSGGFTYRNPTESWSGLVPPCRLDASTILVSNGDTLRWIDFLGRDHFRQYVTGSTIVGISSGTIFRGDSLHIIVRTADEVRILSMNGMLLATWPTKRAPALDIPILSDVDGDGVKDIIVTDTSGTVWAYQWTGILCGGFPVTTLRDERQLASSIVTLDRSSLGYSDILFGAASGELYWWENDRGRGDMKSLAGLGGSAGTISLFALDNGSTVAGVAARDASGVVRAYRTNIPAISLASAWTSFGGDATRSGFNGRTSNVQVPASTTLLLRDRTYNWPNPVYGSSTTIRFAASKDAGIKIRVFDVTGRLIAELSAQARELTDGEVAWNVAGIQSGIYFAHVEAIAAGSSDSMIIKVAVVK